MMESLAHRWGVGVDPLRVGLRRPGRRARSRRPLAKSGAALRIVVPDTTSSVRSPGRIRSAIAMNHDSVTQNLMTQCARLNTGRIGAKNASIGDPITA